MFELVVMLGCTSLTHNGFNPICSIMGRARNFPTSVVLYLSLCMIFDFVTGVSFYTLPHRVVWVALYLCISRYAKPGLSSTVSYCFGYWLLSNTVCFFQMSPWFYSFDVYGYVSCLVAGLPYALRGLLASSIFDAVCYVLTLRVRSSRA